MKLTDFYHRHRLHRLSAHKDFYLFELAIWLHSVAESLVWVFVPILLFKAGYAVPQILAYYLVFNIIDVPLNFGVERLLRKIGARAVLIIATLVAIGYFTIIGIVPMSGWVVLFSLAALGALYDTTFWVSHFYIFIEANRKGLDTGRSAGALEGVRKLANILGPAAGAALLAFSSQAALIATSVILFALSIWPLFRMRHTSDLPDRPRLPFKRFFAEPAEKRDYLSMLLWGIHLDADAILWPLFIFLAFGSIGAVAAVPIAIALTSAAFSYIAGCLTKRYALAMTFIGGLTIAAAWVVRADVSSAALYYASVFLVGFASLLIFVPLDGSIVRRGLEKGALEASVYRNAASMAIRIPLYATLLLLVDVFRFSFNLAAASVFVTLLVIAVFEAKIKRLL